MAIKSALIFLVSLFLALSSQAQGGGITGTVFDAQTSKPLPFANVFINQTTIGTTTDVNGTFELLKIPAGTVKVIFSFVGYESFEAKIEIAENERVTLTVKLSQEDKVLEALSVESVRDKEWERHLKKFTKVFLGDGRRSDRTKILNPWVLEFQEGKVPEGVVMTASAVDPITIENLAMGYNVTCFLQRFVSAPDSYVIQGNFRFQEMGTLDVKLADRWEQSRLEAYNGSLQHLVRSLLSHTSEQEGFMIYTGKPGYERRSVRSLTFAQELSSTVRPLDPTEIIITEDKASHVTHIRLKENLEVHYTKAKTFINPYSDINYPVSWIELKHGTLDVNSSGLPLNPEQMTTSGFMSALRVADKLPTNYLPQQNTALIRPVDSLSVVEKKSLKERPYLSTDKSNYYAGDVLWFSGFMNYGDRDKMDSLSRVLYVDLINPEKVIVQSSICFIKNGRVTGDLRLKDSMTPGVYYLRAYTTWMRNFGDDDFFIKAIPVLSTTEQIINSKSDGVQTKDVQLMIRADKKVYKQRDKITLEVAVVGDDGNPLSAEFSLSVTDSAQVGIVQYKKITDIFTASVKSSHEKIKPNFPIEYGITLHGAFRNNYKKLEKANITVVRGSVEEVVTAKTDDDGAFNITGFQFQDSVDFAFQVKDRKGKRYGKVSLFPAEVPVITDLPAPPSYEVGSKTIQAQPRIEYKPSSKLLDEVTVVATPLPSETSRLGMIDFSVTGEALAKEKAANLVLALQRKVPSLRYLPIMDRNGIRYTLSMGATPRDVREPLLLLNGRPYFQGDGVVNKLNTISTSSIDRIDIVKQPIGLPSFGVQAAGGIIAVYFKENEFTDNEPREQYDTKFFDVIKVRGFSTPHEFSGPDYENQSDSGDAPDQRSTLYWNPSVASGEDGKAYVSFYASDLITRYNIVIEGMTSVGRPFHANSSLKVGGK